MPQWIRVARVTDCPVGTVHEYVAGSRVLAMCNVGGTLYALDGVCPHQGGPLGKGRLDAHVLTCPWHGWRIDVTTGGHLPSGAACQQVLNVRTREPWIEVQLDEA